MFPKLLINLIFLIFFSSAFALNLEEAIEIAISNGDEQKKIESDISSYNAAIGSSFEQVFLPSVSVSRSIIRENPNNLTDFGDSKVDTFDLSYSLSGIYKGSFGFAGGIAAANANKSLSKQAQSDFILSVISAFFDVLQAEKKVLIYEKSFELNQKLFKQVSERVSRGSAKKTSLYLIEAQLAEVEAGLELEKNNLEIARNKFLIKVGVPAFALSEPNLILNEYKNMDEFLKTVEEKNFLISASKGSKNASKFDLIFSSSDFLPDISVSYQKYLNDNVALGFAEDSSKLTLSARFYLYKPGLISSVIRKGYEYQSSKYSYATTFKTTLNDAKDLWFRWQYYKSVLNSKESLVKARSSIVKELEQDYLYGRAELTDKLNEETKLREAELELLKSKYDLLFTIYKMRAIAGEKIS